MSLEAQKFVLEDIEKQTNRTKMSINRLLKLYGIKRSTFYGWTGEAPVAPFKRTNILRVLPDEEQAVLEFRRTHREVGYRKLTWLMNDRDVAALSESTVYGLLKKHGLLGPWQRTDNGETEKEYRHKPTKVHEHWHTDIAYIKVRGVFYFLIMLLDGYSRYVLDWELMPDMLGRSVEDFVQRGRDKYPGGTPKLIHDNGSQFISRDFKMLVSKLDIQQVFTRRNHPQTNGKAERWNGLVKQEAIRPNSPGSFQEAWQIIADFVLYYNHQRLHASINFLRPVDMFTGQDKMILQKRKERIEVARSVRIASNKLNQGRETANFS